MVLVDWRRVRLNDKVDSQMSRVFKIVTEGTCVILFDLQFVLMEYEFYIIHGYPELSVTMRRLRPQQM